MGISAQMCPNGTCDQAQGPVLCPRRIARGSRRHIRPSHGLEHHMHGIGVRRDSRLAPHLCGLLQRIRSSQAEYPHVDPPAQGVQVHQELLKNPYSRFGLISSCADQFNSWCFPMLRYLFTCIFHNL